MSNKLLLNGKIVSGLKQGAFFTQLDWFQEQCLEKLGYTPYPGTLNIEISVEDIPEAAVIEQKAEIEFIPPDSTFCSGRAYPVRPLLCRRRKPGFMAKISLK
jgi:CTP-dependent riboflavin kinase